MPDHEDTDFREQEVAPPGDLAWHTDAAGILVATGTCPVCHSATAFPLPTVVPGTVAKGLPWPRAQQQAPAERTMDCGCPRTHPRNTDEFPGCGAWWTVRVPSPAPGTP
ncbi:hypothetical protein ACWERV_16045 [Streptomyces sp. NPDC004031]